MPRLSTAGRRAWAIAGAILLAWSASDLALRVAELTGPDGPRPLPRRVVAAWIARGAATAAAPALVLVTLRHARPATDAARRAWLAVALAVLAALVATTLFDALLAPRLL